MSLPGLLVEYLITGAICIVWIVVGVPGVEKYSGFSFVLLPIAYVLGMAIDLIAYALT